MALESNEAKISCKAYTSIGDDSSESDGETEPAKSFHRRFSTNKNIKASVSTKEGFLMKQTSSFQRWRRRYFKLKGRTLYYAKDTKSAIFDEIGLSDLSVAECSTKNVNHSFQVITPFRSLVLCADSRREMEDWIAALKAVTSKEYYDSGDHHDFLSGRHNWYASSHARPTYCNVCREALSGVTSHGLSCEVCKFKSHKRCAAKAINNCKWTTLASVGKDIIEDEEGNIAMPHQWMEGNLPVSAKCSVCDKTCGSVLRLQDWRCLWCREMVHTACRPQYPIKCPLGPCRVSIVPPTALHSVGTDEAWEAVRPQGCSPLLVFVNSKSGDNQGVKFLRRFKQLLNPAQVFDLMNGGPGLGLRLFRHFDPFRILICSGDGSVGWVLTEIDKLHMQKQCQIGVLPLGTGNDLARVIGWGSVCDDDAHLPQLLERYEKASVKMLDRWSILTSERSMPLPRKLVLPYEPIVAFEDSVVTYLSKILQSEDYTVIISSAKILCETIKEFISKMGFLHSESSGKQTDGEDSIAQKCSILNEKLDLLLSTLHDESSKAASMEEDDLVQSEMQNLPQDTSHVEYVKPPKESREGRPVRQRATRKRTKFVHRETLMSRANSLKKAVRQIIEHAERTLDEQNAQARPTRCARSASTTLSQNSGGDIKLIVTQPDDTMKEDIKPVPAEVTIKDAQPMATLQLYCAGGSGESSVEPSPCPSPIPVVPSLTTNFPLLPTSPLRYPHMLQPGFYRMATPPNLQPQRPRNEVRVPRLACQESLESEGDEDREAVLSLQAKLHAISPVPESETRTSVEFDFSALALPVPLEFADTDSLQDISQDVFDEDLAIGNVTVRDPIASIELDDEPAEVEVKPILSAQANISVVVEPPSSEDQDSSEALTDNRENKGTQDNPSEALAALGERIVEGAEEPSLERGSSVYQRGNSRHLHALSPTLASPPIRVARVHDNLKGTIKSPPQDKLQLQPSPTASRRISSGSMLHSLRPPTAPLSPVAPATYSTIRAPSPEEMDKEKQEKDKESAPPKKRKMPIINPLVSLPMWPNVETGGLISKVLLANADALCAAVSPLMDVEEDPLDLMDEKCTMNSYFGIGIDAKITLDFHMKREEHPEKCRSRARNYMWYGVLGSKEWLQKTYKNLEQRVLLECDGTRIPLPSLQGIVVLNIPSFMGGTNFWGGNKEDDCFIAPSFDDRVLEVVAVFGSVQMAASRIINLQHHRIAQCHSVKITILGDEGVPVQVDGEAWLQPPGFIRIVHKNRMQMLCRNRALERSLEAWQEKQRYQSVTGNKMVGGSPLSEEENQLLIGFLEAATALVRYVRLLAISQPDLDQELYSLATHASSVLDKMHPGGKIIAGVSLRLHLTDLVNVMRQLHHETELFLKERASLYNLRPDQEENLASSLAHLVSELRKCTEINGLVHLISSDEDSEKRQRTVKASSGSSGGLFKLKFRKPESRPRSSQGLRGMSLSEGSQHGPSQSNVLLWSNEEVAAWLESLQLGEYREDFISHDIRGPELLTLERRDLKELGIHKVGHIKRIQQAILEIKESAPSQP